MLPSSTVENYLKAIHQGQSSLGPDPRLTPVCPCYMLLRLRELDHPERDIEADDARPARREREGDVARAGREVEGAGARARHREIDEPPLPSPVLAVRQDHRDEDVPIGDRREGRAHEPALAVRRGDAVAQ